MPSGKASTCTTRPSTVSVPLVFSMPATRRQLDRKWRT